MNGSAHRMGGDRGAVVVRVAGTRPHSRERHGDDHLRLLLASARERFGVAAFWNAPVLPDPIDEAELVVGRLRKYGGRRGWTIAAEIERVVKHGAGAHGANGTADQGPAPDRVQSVAQ